MYIDEDEKPRGHVDGHKLFFVSCSAQSLTNTKPAARPQLRTFFPGQIKNSSAFFCV
jgi:hypothetical protein